MAEFDEFAKIEQAIEEGTKGFFYTTPIVERVVKGSEDANTDNEDATEKTGKSMTLELDAKTILMLGAVSGLNVMLVGKKGGGKTSLSKAVMASLYGENYDYMQLDSGFSMDKFRNLDFKAIQRGGTLADAVQATKFITAPGLVLDEYNRAPPVITSTIQGLLTNESIVAEGDKEMPVGIKVKLSDGRETRYQWKIANVNNGSDYTGTFGMDAASLDRFPIILDLDAFPQTEEDSDKMLANGAFMLQKKEGEGVTAEVTALFGSVRNIGMSKGATAFIRYISKLDNCIRSPEGTKLTLINFSTTDTCTGCTASAKGSGNLCGNVFAPSQRNINNLAMLAKALAAYRYFKTPKAERTGKLEATITDIMAVAPLVLNSDRLGLEDGYVVKLGQGSRLNTVSQVMKQLYSGFSNFVHVIQESIESKDDAKLEQLTRKDTATITTAEAKAIYEKDRERVRTN